MDYYNSKIQLCKEVIDDVFTHFRSDTKMLVFGLGYDSMMWYEGNSKNTFFIEHDETYIKLNKDIPASNIVKYDYTTTCSESMKLSDDTISSFIIPENIINQGPFDIIIIDGPPGGGPKTPGRLIPSYWSTLLSKPGTVIYIDDSSRPLEDFCIQKYFKDYPKKVFDKRNKCVKVYI
jgi:hypothetical protein